jgi:hypothetical protein
LPSGVVVIGRQLNHQNRQLFARAPFGTALNQFLIDAGDLVILSRLFHEIEKIY